MLAPTAAAAAGAAIATAGAANATAGAANATAGAASATEGRQAFTLISNVKFGVRMFGPHAKHVAVLIVVTLRGH